MVDISVEREKKRAFLKCHALLDALRNLDVNSPLIDKTVDGIRRMVAEIVKKRIAVQRASARKEEQLFLSAQHSSLEQVLNALAEARPNIQVAREGLQQAIEMSNKLLGANAEV